MSTTLSSINIDTQVKRDAMRNAKALGLQFSTLVNGLLRSFNNDKRITFELPEIPNARTAKILREARADFKAGRNIMKFDSPEEMDAYLLSL
jgi:antitoxin component of RelBE/YafQ-DinJ toxin-antitoxin module